MGRACREQDRERLFHVVTRGNNGERIVRDAVDQALFREELSRVAEKYRWEVWAWCLLSNHYVARNPLKAGLCASAAEWHDSSYRATVGLDPAPRWLAVDHVLSLFGKDSSEAVAAYCDVVHKGHLSVSDTIEKLSRSEPVAGFTSG